MISRRDLLRRTIDEARKLVTCLEIIDGTHWRGVWRGQTYECRQFPTTSSLSVGDQVVCHVMPGTTELFSTEFGHLLWAATFSGSIYHKESLTSPWIEHVLDEQDGWGDESLAAFGQSCFGGTFYQLYDAFGVPIDSYTFYTIDKGVTWLNMTNYPLGIDWDSVSADAGVCLAVSSLYITPSFDRTFKAFRYAGSVWSEVLSIPWTESTDPGWLSNNHSCGASIRGNYAWLVFRYPETSPTPLFNWRIYRSTDAAATWALVYSSTIAPPGAEDILNTQFGIDQAADGSAVYIQSSRRFYVYDGALNSYGEGNNFWGCYRKSADSFVHTGTFAPYLGGRLQKFNLLTLAFEAFTPAYNGVVPGSIVSVGGKLVVAGIVPGAFTTTKCQYQDAGVWIDISIPGAYSRMIAAQKE